MTGVNYSWLKKQRNRKRAMIRVMQEMQGIIRMGSKRKNIRMGEKVQTVDDNGCSSGESCRLPFRLRCISSSRLDRLPGIISILKISSPSLRHLPPQKRVIPSWVQSLSTSLHRILLSLGPDLRHIRKKYVSQNVRHRSRPSCRRRHVEYVYVS